MKSKADFVYIFLLPPSLSPQGVQRTSNLLSPIMALDGHQGEIFTCAFNTDGDYLVSSGFDRQICEEDFVSHCCCCCQEDSFRRNILTLILFSF